MFGLMTKRRARSLAAEAMGYGASRAVEVVQRQVDQAMQELTPAVADLRNRADQLERDLEIAREREAELMAEVKRLRAKVGNMVELERVSEKDWRIRELEAQLLDARCLMAGHFVVDDYGTQFVIFDPPLQARDGCDTTALFSPGAPVRFEVAGEPVQRVAD